jgi:hypothetical protein
VLDTLSEQEKQAVAYYDTLIRSGDTDDCRVWVDDFTCDVFFGFGADDEVVDVGCRIGRFVPLLQ